MKELTDIELQAILACHSMAALPHRIDAAREIVAADRALNAADRDVPAEEGESICQEVDGCPTEKAALQRFWRKHQSTGTPVAWLLTDKNINHIQVESVQRLIDRAKGAHYTDLVIRVNGKDEHYQADWLKHLTRAIPPSNHPADPDVMRQVAAMALRGTPLKDDEAEQQPVEMSPEFTDTARAALLWVLWHHQGANSPVGQPIRFALGMGRDDHLMPHQIAEAKRWDAIKSAEQRGAQQPAPMHAHRCAMNHFAFASCDCGVSKIAALRAKVEAMRPRGAAGNLLLVADVLAEIDKLGGRA